MSTLSGKGPGRYNYFYTATAKFGDFDGGKAAMCQQRAMTIIGGNFDCVGNTATNQFLLVNQFVHELIEGNFLLLRLDIGDFKLCAVLSSKTHA